MSTVIAAELSKIIITSKTKAPRKRTINECADILSSFGQLIDFESCASDSVKFYVEVKQEEISTLINSLKRMEYINEDINSHITLNKELKRKPMLLNISLNFLSN